VADKPTILLVSVGRGHGSGAERVLEYLLAGGCETFVDRVVVAAPPKSAVGERAASLGYRVLPWLCSGDASSFRDDAVAAIRMLKSARDLQPTLLHSWHTRSFELVGALAAVLGRPCTGTLHDHPLASGYSGTRHRLIHWGARRMKSVVCVSRAQLDACVAAGWKTPLYLIHNGLPDTGVSASPSAQGQGLSVAFLGCSEKWKGADFTVALARRKISGIQRWNLYGAITPGSAPILQTPKLNLGAGVVYRGQQEPSLIFSENDLVLHPSTRFDPYPTVLLESSRAGLPAIASRTGGAAEIVIHEETGLLFDAGDELSAAQYLERLAASPNLREELSRSARARYQKHFRVETMVFAYDRFWTDFAADRP
jgi:glycosyltransferase involved in cell wall biosynthesis